MSKDEPTTSKERMCAICMAGVICCFALAVDGVTAITMSIAVAGGLAGIGGYAVGRIKR